MQGTLSWKVLQQKSILYPGSRCQMRTYVRSSWLDNMWLHSNDRKCHDNGAVIVLPSQEEMMEDIERLITPTLEASGTPKEIHS
ncbi:hypothetical protein CUMW_280480 [Citrus unshiu]|uniref:Uncharacterized protein n=1 Tax=Citrus unshiu TaxID=55188 RepID=A0A2H5NBU1_CITUN|nr:hypothetical protein CUMW_280480 [Citrus unshiu]